jgi:acid phosphatase family membrane protein YuiD
MSTVPTSAAGATTAGFRVIQLIPDTQITSSCTYVSGGAPSATSVVVSGLTVGQVLPVGTDLFNLVNGQLQFTGSTVSTAATVTTTGNTTLTVTSITTQVAGTVVLVQTPEAAVKYNFGVHRYNIA